MPGAFGFDDTALSGQFADVTRYRGVAGSYVAGRWTAGAQTSATIRASVQPMPSDEAQDLPEAVRTRGVFNVFSASEMVTLSEAILREEDEVDWNGERLHVLSVDRWQVGGMDH